MTVDEFHECDAALRRDPRVIEALAARGITDMELVLIDTWAYGAHLLPEPYDDRRLGWADVWHRSQEGSSPYAQPRHRAALHRRPQPHGAARDRGHAPRRRAAARWASTCRASCPGCGCATTSSRSRSPSPRAPRSRSTATSLRWQKWSLRVGFNHREGMVLHTVGYDDGGRTRPVAHRLSFAEMVVPYRDPTPDHYRRTAFDIGEWGLGFMTTSLELGCDCLGEIAYLDAALHDTRGEPYAIRNAICIHEEDNAVLWKHVDAVARRGGPAPAPARALLPRDRRQLRVPRLLAALPGRQHRVRGARDRDHGHDALPRGRAAALRHARRRAHLRAVPPALPRRAARPRRRRRGQHRLRDRVRGAAGRARTTRTGSRSCSASTPLRTERGGQAGLRLAAPSARGRSSTTASRNGLGTPVGYKLVPGAAIPPMLDPARRCCGRAEAIGAHAVGHAVRRRRALAVRRVRRPEPRGRRRRAARLDRRRTGRSRTPTSSCGTCSGSTTSRARRNGR